MLKGLGSLLRQSREFLQRHDYGRMTGNSEVMGQDRLPPGQKSASGKLPLQVTTADRQSVGPSRLCDSSEMMRALGPPGRNRWVCKPTMRSRHTLGTQNRRNNNNEYPLGVDRQSASRRRGAIYGGQQGSAAKCNSAGPWVLGHRRIRAPSARRTRCMRQPS
jgi:hypothetical protein